MSRPIYAVRDSKCKIHCKNNRIVTTTDPDKALKLYDALKGVAILKLKKLSSGTLYVTDEIRGFRGIPKHTPTRIPR